MLAQLTQLLKDNSLDFYDAIKDVDNSCCPSAKVVLDFDKVKDTFVKTIKLKGDVPKSVDALLIKEKDQEIVFLEMKDSTTLLDDLKGEIAANPALNAIGLAKQLFQVQFRPDQKILDSLFLLSHIGEYYVIDSGFFKYLLTADCKKTFVFLLGGTSRDFVKLGFAISPFKYRYKYYCLEDVKFIPANNFDHHF